jgi:aldehyde dehydrogenase (NAD+)
MFSSKTGVNFKYKSSFWGIIMNETLSELINQVFLKQQLRKIEQKNTTFIYRRTKLLKFRSLLLSREAEVQSALMADFGKAALESTVTETMPIISMLNFHIKNLKKWMKPKKTAFSPLFLGTKSYTSFEGKGNCLILSPWNYPFNLSIYPVLTAFSAGNTVILKPSEYTPHTNKVIMDLFSVVFDEDEVCVIDGEVEASTLLLEKPFDHIFFTGSTPVGKIVMKKASEHLASVSLELGGKSPALIDKKYSVKESAEKIAWGKFVNAGQTCVAPDYVLVDPSQETSFINELKKSIKSFYGDEPIKSNDYCQIITAKHGIRLQELVDDAIKLGAILHCGGHFDSVSRKFEPTVISNIPDDSMLMKEEIFGPILPIIRENSVSSMIDYVNRNDNPLALYVFSDDQDFIESVRRSTSSGGFSINETLLHLGNTDLPFGGAGKSGIGRYHSHHGFEELSNQRAVLHRKREYGLKSFYPPYTKEKERLLKFTFKYFSRFL